MYRLPMPEKIILNSQKPQLRNASPCHQKKTPNKQKNKQKNHKNSKQINKHLRRKTKMKNKMSAYLLKVTELKKCNRVNTKTHPTEKIVLFQSAVALNIG